jgi:hypothetical protein
MVCVASRADARRRHHGYYGYSERYSARGSLDDWRRAREAQGQDQARGDDQDQDLGQDRRQDRYDRARYDRRRARTLDVWRRSRDRGDWQRSRDDWRRARYDDRRRYREREDLARAAAAERGDLVLRRGRSGPLARQARSSSAAAPRKPPSLRTGRLTRSSAPPAPTRPSATR